MSRNTIIKIILLILGVIVLITVVVFYNKPKEDKQDNVILSYCHLKTPDSTLSIKHNSSVGSYYGNSRCMTLYVYAKDSPNKSNCYDKCAETWIPYIKKEKGDSDIIYPEITSDLDEDISKKIKTFERSDGVFQYALDGKPLYLFFNDKTTNDTNGLNFQDKMWSIINSDVTFDDLKGKTQL